MELIIPTMKTNKPKVQIALIDFDVLRYEIGSVQFDHSIIEGEKMPAPVRFIEELVDDRINTILERTGADDYICFVTGPGNFRFDIAKQQPYKGNRDDFEKPFHWKTVDEYGRRKYALTEICGTEADDAIGIRQRELNLKGITTVIASRDKDLRMVEGYHYSWACGENQPEKPLYYVDKMKGLKFFFKQMLTGDAVDNICGCGRKEKGVYKSGKKIGQEYYRRKGVGPVAAEKLLKHADTPKEWYEIVKHQYMQVFGNSYKDVMLENARLLYIGQEGGDDLFEWSWLGVEDGLPKNNIIQNEQGQEPSGMDDMDGGRSNSERVRETEREDAAEGGKSLSEESRPF